LCSASDATQSIKRESGNIDEGQLSPLTVANPQFMSPPLPSLLPSTPKLWGSLCQPEIVVATSVLSCVSGYGHLTPKTSSGQLFCILYSLVAIPVTGIMLISVGSHVSLSLQLFIAFIEKKILRRETQINTSTGLKSTVVTFVFMILIIIFGALLTSHTDGWTFVEGMYFTFISLSTIGFGDYIINNGELNDPDDKKAVAVNFTIVLITIGLCVVSSVLCSVSSVIEEKQRRMRKQLALSNAAVPGRLAMSAVNKIGKVGKSSQSENDNLTQEEKV